jgi:signal transduction histidine kinase
MRRVLGVLPGNGSDDGLAARPSFTHLDSLLEQFRGAGLAVDLEVDGEPRMLPAGLDLAAFRIVQEALTNTLKHARATTARVDLRYRPDALDVEIVDDGVGGASPARAGGHGLVGMRERVAIYGGQLEAGPGAGGGFAVKAHLPLAGSAT